jgi:hypothetical protein
LVERWVRFELVHFEKRWREVFRGKLRMKKDSEVTPDDIKDFNLVLWGDPQSNAVMARIVPNLPPIAWHEDVISAGAQSFPASSHVPSLVYPNPLEPTRYVVINSEPTFREAHDKTNSLQNPKLPDWAIIDLAQNPDAASPGRIAAAGFFDERWRLK